MAHLALAKPCLRRLWLITQLQPSLELLDRNLFRSTWVRYAVETIEDVCMYVLSVKYKWKCNYVPFYALIIIVAIIQSLLLY